MSRGFVKEDDLEHAGTDLPERPLSPHPNYVTPHGFKLLQQQASALEQERQPLTMRKDDPAVQQRLAMIDRDLRYLQARLESAIVVDPATQPTDTVLFGATVEVEDENGNSHTFMIVGEDEADIATNRVSWVSPLAKALIGQKIGDSVTWHRPAGNLELEIIAIHY
ncbi:GreA/GreB family elongation factor [Methylobacillus flagellatus]|uniref:GreA/GreB family elongation factor n=1 Tax=Methylobacillus flagellatus (strain ATCC 51484 / DSM 6875 / VKM B-1610 / KT) TaxID=265072 RepID=Q1H282_METFK|nr:GreA/GreB family elongation factor [Methylobacillus flagellatus]ABE49405.1 GreA/GreB family elongation factor [Methylobacillus flagellatus KT]